MMHSNGKYLYSVPSLDAVCVVVCLVAQAWWLFIAGKLTCRVLLLLAILKYVFCIHFHVDIHMF